MPHSNPKVDPLLGMIEYAPAQDGEARGEPLRVTEEGVEKFRAIVNDPRNNMEDISELFRCLDIPFHFLEGLAKMGEDTRALAMQALVLVGRTGCMEGHLDNPKRPFSRFVMNNFLLDQQAEIFAIPDFVAHCVFMKEDLGQPGINYMIQTFSTDQQAKIFAARGALDRLIQEYDEAERFIRHVKSNFSPPQLAQVIDIIRQVIRSPSFDQDVQQLSETVARWRSQQNLDDMVTTLRGAGYTVQPPGAPIPPAQG